MNVVIYARFSSARQNETSIEAQLEECYNYCKQNDSKLTDYSVSPAWRKIYEEFGLNIDVFK